uniref:Cystatin domain-containing protein n=1 Tax=Micrurus spixii TaxID=129469 RepID=A0A2D4LIF6_9SAUR
MGRSRLPFPSLLGLFGALLMLSPELLMVNTEYLYDAPYDDPGVKEALAFAVEQYNLNREDSANYFKVFRVLKTQWKIIQVEYHFMVDLVKTRCKKKVGKIKKYKKIQQCKQLPGNQERPNCYFAVVPGTVPFEMQFKITACV